MNRNTNKISLATTILIAVLAVAVAPASFAGSQAEDEVAVEIPRFAPRTGITEPMAMVTPKPVFTEAAAAAALRGVMVLDLVVDAEGVVQEVTPLRTLDHGMTERTVEAVKTWRFKPATRGGEPLTVRYKMAMRVAQGR